MADEGTQEELQETPLPRPSRSLRGSPAYILNHLMANRGLEFKEDYVHDSHFLSFC